MCILFYLSFFLSYFDRRFKLGIFIRHSKKKVSPNFDVLGNHYVKETQPSLHNDRIHMLTKYPSIPTHLKTKLLNGVHIHENNFYKFVNVFNTIQNCNPLNIYIHAFYRSNSKR